MTLPKVAVVIPCYRARGMVGAVVDKVLEVAVRLGDRCEVDVLVVDDGCPLSCV